MFHWKHSLLTFIWAQLETLRANKTTLFVVWNSIVNNIWRNLRCQIFYLWPFFIFFTLSFWSAFILFLFRYLLSHPLVNFVISVKLHQLLRDMLVRLCRYASMNFVISVKLHKLLRDMQVRLCRYTSINFDALRSFLSNCEIDQ